MCLLKKGTIFFFSVAYTKLDQFLVQIYSKILNYAAKIFCRFISVQNIREKLVQGFSTKEEHYFSENRNYKFLHRIYSKSLKIYWKF